MKKKIQSLSKWQNLHHADTISIWKIQDKYLEMTTGQLFEYMRKKYSDIPDIIDRIPDKDTGNEVIGRTIQRCSERVEEELNLMFYEMQSLEESILFAILILPFVGFVMDAGYIPEQSIIERSNDVL